MRATILLLTLCCVSILSFAQEMVAYEIPNTEVHHYFGDYAGFRDGKLYFISNDERSIGYFAPGATKMTKILTVTHNEWIKSFKIVQDQICYEVYSNIGAVSHMASYRPNGTNATLVTYSGSNYGNLVFDTLINNHYYFVLNTSDNEIRFYDYSLQNNNLVLEFSESGSAYYVSKLDDGYFYSKTLTSTTSISKFRNQSSEQILYQGSEIMRSELSSNDSGALYIKTISSSIWKLNKSTHVLNKFTSTSACSNFAFQGFDCTFNYFGFLTKGQVVEDTLQIESSYNVKGQPGQLGISISDAPFAAVTNLSEGLELYQLDAEDSLIPYTNRPGFFSSFYLSSCAESYNYLFGFMHEQKLHVIANNAFDNKNYLCSVDDSGFQSVCEYPGDFNSQTIIENDEVLILQTYSASNVKKFYVRNWTEPAVEMATVAPDSSIYWTSSLILQQPFNSGYYCNFDYYNLKFSGSVKDDENNTFVTYRINDGSGFDFPTGGIFSSSLYQETDTVRASTLLAKFDKFGKLCWVNGIGYQYAMFFSNDVATINKAGNPIIYGVYYKTGIFDNDTLTSPSTGYYYAELDKVTGDVIDHHKLFETTYVDDVRYSKILVDEDGNHVIAVEYLEFELSIGDTVIYSDYYTQNALLKFDEHGNFLKAMNVVNSWNDYVGSINDFVWDNEHKEYAVLCSQIDVSTCSSPNNKPWKGELIVLDENGREKNRLLFQGSVLENPYAICLLNDHKIMIRGEAIGNFNTPFLSTSTPVSDDCFERQSIEIVVDLNLNRIISAKKSEGNLPFVPMKIVKHKTMNYFLGSKDEKVTVVRYDDNGKYSGEFTYPLRFQKDLGGSVYFDFDVTDSTFMFTGTEFQSVPSMGINTFYEFYNPVYVASIPHPKWQYKNDMVSLLLTNPTDESDNNLLVFPNPTNDFLEVYLTPGEGLSFSYEVVDITGKFIEHGEVTEQQYLRLKVDQYSNGMYTIRLTDEKEIRSVKFVKY